MQSDTATIVCPVCGKEFTPRNSRSRYCSASCYYKAMNRKRVEYKKALVKKRHAETVKVCPECGVHFHPKIMTQVYCGEKCRVRVGNRIAYNKMMKRRGGGHRNNSPMVKVPFNSAGLSAREQARRVLLLSPEERYEATKEWGRCDPRRKWLQRLYFEAHAYSHMGFTHVGTVFC